MRKRRNVEASIQRAFVSWLQKNHPEIKVAASQNENSRHATHLGTDVGEPDIRLCKRVGNTAHFLYLELKTSKGKLGENQIKWNADFDANWRCDNFKRDVAYGFAEAIEAVAAWSASLASLRVS